MFSIRLRLFTTKGANQIKLTKITLAARGAGCRDARPQGFDVGVVGVVDYYPGTAERRNVVHVRYSDRETWILRVTQ